MSVVADDLTEPKGDLSLELFPSLDAAGVASLLGGYIADAENMTDPAIVGGVRDLAVKAWSYARAFRNVALRLSRDPASATIAGEGSTIVTGEQIRTFKAEALKWEAEYRERTSIDTGEAGDGSTGSVTIANAFTF